MSDTIFSEQEYLSVLDETFETIKKLGKLKGGEYSGDVDRLQNFRRNGAEMELPMETVWRVYIAKHWDAIKQYELDLRNGTTRPRLESITGRIDDMVLYLCLFKCMVIERTRAAARDNPPQDHATLVPVEPIVKPMVIAPRSGVAINDEYRRQLDLFDNQAGT